MKQVHNFTNRAKITLLLSILIISCVGFTIFQQSDSIVGTWIDKEDSNSKWVFTDDSQVKTYYANELLDTFTYNLSRSSPKCGRNIESEINSRPKLNFLELTETDSGDQYCYYVFGLDEDNLSLKPFNGAKILLFDRQ